MNDPNAITNMSDELIHRENQVVEEQQAREKAGM